MLAPIKTSAGVYVGWGATCGRHHDAGDSAAAVCKKQLRYSKNTEVETKRLVKSWCLMGFDIPTDEPMGKWSHIQGINRFEIPLLTDAELEARRRELEAGQ